MAMANRKVILDPHPEPELCQNWICWRGRDLVGAWVSGPMHLPSLDEIHQHIRQYLIIINVKKLLFYNNV